MRCGGAGSARSPRSIAIPSVSAEPRPPRRRPAAQPRTWPGWRAAPGWRSRSRACAAARRTSSAAPTAAGGPALLAYGHYDVQPAGGGWHGDPFAPVVREGKLYGRGASDDKGQLFIHLAALEAYAATAGRSCRST